MAIERTLSIIKPDAVAKNVIGRIITRFETIGLKVIDMKMQHLNKVEAQGFYTEHKGRPFFNDLIDFMTSGLVVIQILEGEDAIQKSRKMIGDTNPQEAAEGTIRYDFAQSIDANAIHGSDSLVSAEREIAYFFPD